jgi:hypothetical protein
MKRTVPFLLFVLLLTGVLTWGQAVPASAEPATANLQFTVNSPSVRTGDRLTVTLSTSPLSDSAAVDLYVAVRKPDGGILFFTGDPFDPFSAAAATYRRALTVTDTSYEVLNFLVPDGVPPGTYTFLGAFIRLGRPPSITEIVGQLAQVDVAITGGGTRPGPAPSQPPTPPVVGPSCTGTIQLFTARATFATAPENPPTMTSFGRASRSVSFPSGARAVLSSTRDGSGSFVVDNYLAINGANPCPNRGSCFGSITDTTVIGRPIEDAVRPIPPLDVSTFIPRGTSTVTFELIDTGVIAGNTNVYLVMTGPGCPFSGEGVGTISGLVRDSQTGRPLPGVSLTVSGGGGSAVTAADGTFTVTNVPVGPVTITASLAGYITASRDLTILANQTASANLALTQQGSLGAGQIRVVLSWGQSPRDLDSHLTGPPVTGTTRFHVYYASRGSLTGSPHANLDRDDTDSIGPETITIAQVRPGVYRYSVHDYTNRSSTTSTALSQSSAHVAVFSRGEQVAAFDVPRNTAGTVWTVFELEEGQIRPIDRMSFASSPSDITKFGLFGAAGEDPALFRDLPAK